MSVHSFVRFVFVLLVLVVAAKGWAQDQNDSLSTDSATRANPATATPDAATTVADSVVVPADSTGSSLFPAGKKVKVFRFDINEEIMSPIWHKTQRAFAQMAKSDADMMLVVLNTYGGRVDIADSIRTRLLHAEFPVFVYIRNNAASAGALISLACDSIYMQPGSTIGAATVVSSEDGQPVPDKYQSYFRAKMRETASQNGRNPDIAEGMVDPDKYIPGISDSGKVITFDTDAALKNGYCEAVLNNVAEVMTHAGISDYEITTFQESGVDSVIGFLLNDALRGILVLVIIGGLYFELQTPGVGFPIIASITAAVLYFAPSYLEGLASNWEILLFFIGIILLAVEIFVIPGFGVAGVSGVLCIGSSLVLVLIDNNGLDFSFVPADAIVRSMFVVILSSTLAVAGSIWAAHKLLGSRNMLGRFVLDATQERSEGYVSTDTRLFDMVGKTGVAATVLRPSGKVEIDGDLHDATAEVGFLDKDTPVTVVKYETAQLVVRASEPDEA